MRSAIARSSGSSIWGLALLACLVVAADTLYDVIERYRRLPGVTQADLGTVALAVEAQPSTTSGAMDSILKLVAANTEARQRYAADDPPEPAVVVKPGFARPVRPFAEAGAPLGLAALTTIAIILGLARTAVRRLGSRLVAIGRETEARHAEAMAAARARLDEILEGIDPVVWSCDTSGRLVYVSRRAATVFGQEVSAMLDWPDRFAGCVDEPDRERVLAAWCDWDRARDFEVEYRCRHPDGSSRWIRDRARLMTDETGHQWIDGTSTDVTRAKAAEDALRRSEERLRSVLETMPDGVVVLDATGAVELANPAARAMFGRSDGLDGTPVERLFVLSGNDPFSVASGEAPPVRLLEAEARGEPGEAFPAEVSVGHFLHDVGDHREASTVLAVRDVTEKVQAARRMLHAQRMEAIGRLTSAVFHDFHNLLLVIELNLDMLRREQRSPAETQSLVEPALHAARTCMELTRQLVDFSRRPGGKQSVVNVAEALRSVLPMLKGAATPAVDLDLRIEWPVWSAKLDPHGLDAAIVNLLVNARDAMPSGGRAQITIRNRVLAEALETRLETIPPGDYVECAVADSGVGIADDALDKVVEPFFTTKTIKGTGLGLSNVYKFVHAMDGYMIIESRIGEGTRIALLFPAVLGESIEHEQQEAGAPPSAG